MTSAPRLMAGLGLAVLGLAALAARAPGQLAAGDAKYVIFALLVLGGVPLMCVGSLASSSIRGTIMACAVVATVLAGSHTGLHFMTATDYRGLDRGFEINLVDLLTMAAVIGILWNGPRAVAWLPYGWLPLAVLFGLCVVSGLLGDDPLYSAFTLLKFIRVYLLFWLAANWLIAGVSLRTYQKGLLLAACILLALAFKQHYVDHAYAAIGPMAHQNQLCLYIVQILPIFMLWALRGLEGPASWLYGAVAMALVACIVFTHSRAGTVIAALEVLACLIYANLKLTSTRVRRASVLVAVCCMVGALHAIPSMEQRFKEAPEESLDGRIEFNRAAVTFASQHVLGVGLNNLSRVLTRDWSSLGIDGDILLIEGSDQVGVCHNAYWLMAAETGWLGLAAMLWLLGTFWAMMARGAWRMQGATAALMGGMAIGSIGLHLQNCLEPTFFTSTILYLFALQNGVAVAITQYGQRG